VQQPNPMDDISASSFWSFGCVGIIFCFAKTL
jgi:hypothetical protein